MGTVEQIQAAAEPITEALTVVQDRASVRPLDVCFSVVYGGLVLRVADHVPVDHRELIHEAVGAAFGAAGWGVESDPVGLSLRYRAPRPTTCGTA